MEPAFFVSEFSGPILSILIKQCFGADFSEVEAKVQVRTLVQQLKDLNARTIVCEREYIDRDYAEDYANYYVQSFKDYRGSCARFHFFSKKFSQEDFSGFLECGCPEAVEYLNSAYLGFIVIKPLPFTFLGRTCIRQPASQIAKNYNVNLFGIALSVGAVAFQEQDRVVSACATTAVWSLLHALPETHNKQIPSPSAITLAATGAQAQNANSFPNKGLNLAQITMALDFLKLKQDSFAIEEFDGESLDFFKAFSQSYLASDIPIFLGAQVYKLDGCPDEGKYSYHGDHALVMTGLWQQENFCEIVVHDDRIGPSIRAQLLSVALVKGKTAEVADNCGGHYAFLLPTHELIVPTAALVATYRKKRISVEPVIHTGEQLLRAFKETLSTDNENVFLEIAQEISYSVSLRECHAIKREYFEKKRTETVRGALVAHMPHFLWCVRFCIKDIPIIDLLFDATDSPNGNPYLSNVILDDVFGGFFLELLGKIAQAAREQNAFDAIYRSINKNMISSFHVDVLRRLAPKALTYNLHLDCVYGSLRSPKYMRGEDFFTMPPYILPGDSAGRYRFFSADEVNFPDLTLVVNELAKVNQKNGIWVIDEEGALILGPDSGHPNLTGANPARIAGEIKVLSSQPNTVLINSSSGRYSRQYKDSDCDKYLENARKRFAAIFPSAVVIIEKENAAKTNTVALSRPPVASASVFAD